MNEPKIRFKGFEGEWESPTIEDVFDIRNGYTPSKAVKEFWEGGTIPWFRMEDIRENGGILKDAIQHITPLGVKGTGLFKKNSIILATTATIGEHAMLIADSLANQRFTNFSIRKSLSDKYITDFVYYSFFGIDEWSKKNVNSGGLLSVNMPLLLKQPFLTPEVEEQQAIASYFTHLDSLITTSTSRLASLKQMKAASLQAMFPQEGETVPKIRFKGFEGEWEEKKLGDCVDFLDSQRKPIEECNRIKGKYPYYGASGIVDYVDDYIFDEDLVLLSEDGANITDRNNPLCFIATGKYWVNNHAHVLCPNEDIDKIYLCNALERKDYTLYNTGMAMPKLNKEVCINIPIRIPPLPEQQAIASYFTSLDKQITLQSQRLEKLKQIKSACLDKMFA